MSKRPRELRLVFGQFGGDGLGKVKAVDHQIIAVHPRRQGSGLLALGCKKTLRAVPCGKETGQATSPGHKSSRGFNARRAMSKPATTIRA